MPFADVGSIRSCYEVSGPENGEPLVLIHGLGAQLIAWYPGFCRELELAGFHVIRIDNRDVGLSTKLDGQSYGLREMADDVVGVLDALELAGAHLVGQSMGGMIAQLVAIEAPGRVRSLCSIYSAPNASYLTTDMAFWSILDRRDTLGRDDAIEEWIQTERLSGTDGFDDAGLRDFAAAIVDRNYYPAGLQRQARAMLDAPDRTGALERITAPTAVIHGREDAVIDVRGGVATALAIPGAELHVYSPMGHQVTPRPWGDVARVISRNADRAAGTRPTPVDAGGAGTM